MPVLVNVCAIVIPQAAAQLLKPEIVPPAGMDCIAAVQVNVVPATVEFNATLVVPPLQIVCDEGVAEPTGVGLTVISTVNAAPGQPLADGVTVYLTTPAVVPVLVSVCAIVIPQAAAQLLKPVMVPPDGAVCITAIQVNVVPATVEFNATLVVAALQIV